MLLLAGIIATGLAIVTGSKLEPIAIAALQGVVTVIFAWRLAVKVLHNRAPSPVVLADWIGDAAVLLAWLVVVLASVGQIQGWMHGGFRYATFSILGLFIVGMPVYWWRGQQRVALVLTARAVAGRWPWSAAG